MPQEADRIVYDRVTMAAGDGELRFVLDREAGGVDPYHVLLERISD